MFYPPLNVFYVVYEIVKYLVNRCRKPSHADEKYKSEFVMIIIIIKTGLMTQVNSLLLLFFNSENGSASSVADRD